MDIRERLYKLENLSYSLRENREKILEALEADLGKSMEEAYLSEYLMVVEELAYTIKNLSKWAKKEKKILPIYQQVGKGEIHYRPYGKVAIASPWNYPFLLAMVPAIGALAAGNTVVLKTSKKAPATSKIVKEIFGEVYDEDQVLVYGLEEGDRQRFIDEDMDFLFFTGSTKVGRQMAKLAGEKMIPLVLELGGKSPVIVSEIKNLKTVARRIIWGKTLNAGQTCVAPDYLLVRRDLEEPLKVEMTKAIEEFFGSRPLESPYLSSIIDLDYFNRHVDLLKAQGIYDEGLADPKKLKFVPRVFSTDMTSPFMEEEIFGPFLPIISFETLEECADLIKVHKDPLALYLFTEDEDEVAYVLENISFGGGAINDTLVHLSVPSLPFGGLGPSGQGSYHGKYSFETFSRKVSILKKSSKIDLPFRYPPYKGFDPKKFFKK